MKRRFVVWISTLAFLAACSPRSAVPAAAPHGVLLAEAVPDEPPYASPGAEAALQERDAHDTARMEGWIAIGFGSLASVVAIATSVQMLNDKSTRDANCNANKVCSATGLNANADIAGASGWNIASWAVTAAGLGIGAFLVLGNPSEPESTKVGVAPMSSGSGLELRSAF
jgi:hypothetical protein